MSQATRSGQLETYADTNKVTPNLPVRSAYFDTALSTAGGTYGCASAAEMNNVLYTINAAIAALNTRNVTGTST